MDETVKIRVCRKENVRYVALLESSDRKWELYKMRGPCMGTTPVALEETLIDYNIIKHEKTVENTAREYLELRNQLFKKWIKLISTITTVKTK